MDILDYVRCAVEIPIDDLLKYDVRHELLRRFSLEHPEDLVRHAIYEVPFEQRTFIDGLAKEMDRLEVNTLNQLKFMVDAELMKRDPNLLKEVSDAEND
tara:strand:- start:431 stop:727 length:297 start_codon:yes stop_codon:yes gene_type:complete